jgi:hypothetical protein
MKKLLKTGGIALTFPESTQLIYDNIVSKRDDLKEIIVEAAEEHWAKLSFRLEVMTLLRENGELSTDNLESTTWEKEKKCEKCSRTSIPVCRYRDK